MKAFLLACAGAIVLAVIGAAVLELVQQPADHAFNVTGTKI